MLTLMYTNAIFLLQSLCRSDTTKQALRNDNPLYESQVNVLQLVMVLQ